MNAHSPMQVHPVAGTAGPQADAMADRLRAPVGPVLQRPAPALTDRQPQADPSGHRACIALEAAGIGCHDYHLDAGRLDCDARLREIWSVPSGFPMTLERLIDGVHPEDRPLAQAMMQGPFDPQRRSPRHAEYRVRDARGDERWVRATVSVCFDRGRAVRLIGTAQDISVERAKAAALQATDRAKDELLMMVAHDLRGPLSPILASGHLLAQWAGDALRVRRIAGIVTRQATQMAAILDSLLEAGGPKAARPAGCAPAATVPTMLRAALDIAVETASPVIVGRHQALVTDVGAGLRVLAIDPVQVAQIVSNLLVNASKYTHPGGRIVLRAQARGEDLLLSVQDNGIGIARSALPRLFRMYSRVHDDDRGTGGGHGIGLALVRRLAERHGGTVEARSDGPGSGSEFVVHLPCALAPLPPASAGGCDSLPAGA